MTEKKVETKKVVGRGISNETRSASQRKFHISMIDKTTGLFVGALEDVKVDYMDFKDGDDSKSTFKGLKVPRLSFHFSSLDVNASQRAHVYKTFTPVESTVNTMPGGTEAWKVEGAILGYIKHFLDVYFLKGRELTESEVESLILPLDDVTEDGEFNPLEQEEVVKAYETLFVNVAKLFNTGNAGKPVYKSDKGTPIITWLKLLSCYKAKNAWKHIDNGNLGFSSFVGEGVIEIKKDGSAPLMVINGAIESVSNKVEAKAPTTLPQIPGIPSVGAFTSASPIGASPIVDDLPF